MVDLLEKFSIDEIFIFIIFLAIAIKEIITFIDFFQEKASKRFDLKYHKSEKEKKIIKELETHQNEITTILESQKIIQQQIALLIESDMDDIKAWITEKHHFYCYQKGYIDDYTLDCIEKRYAVYKRENGNSFVSDLMEDLRRLPKVSKDNKKPIK